MQFKIGIEPLFSITVRAWRSEHGASIIVHIWVLKLGTHFGFTAHD